MKYAIWMLLPVLMLGIGCGSDSSTAPSAEQQDVVANTSFTLAPGEFRDYNFSVDLFTQRDVVLVGDFSATGTGNNAIRVLLMTETEFSIWQTTGSATMLYDSGDVASGTLNYSVSNSGLYRLVYSNVADTTGEKSVTTSTNVLYYIIEE